MNTDLVFRELDHTYWLGDELVANTTRVLSGLVRYDHIRREVLERAQQEGTAVHKLVELDCKDDLDSGSLPEWLEGHYKAWCRFKDDSGFECVATEQRLFHPTQRYAGTADLFGHLTKLKIKGLCNLDIKRSFYAGAAIGLQLASYTDAWNATHKDSRVAEANRFALRLDANGAYKLQQFSDRNDFAVWTAQLICYRWEQQNGK